MFAVILSLSACAGFKEATSTATVILKNGNKTITCGGSQQGFMMGGMIGMAIQKQIGDARCVEAAQRKGYTIFQ